VSFRREPVLEPPEKQNGSGVSDEGSSNCSAISLVEEPLPFGIGSDLAGNKIDSRQ
jgi:hypothetical protein